MENAIKILKFAFEVFVYFTLVALVWTGVGKAVLIIKAQRSGITNTLHLNDSSREWQKYNGATVNGDKVNYFIETYDDCFFKVITKKNPSGFSEFSERLSVDSKGYVDNSSVFLCKGIFDNGDLLGMIFLERGVTAKYSESYLKFVQQSSVELDSKIESLSSKLQDVKEPVGSAELAEIHQLSKDLFRLRVQQGFLANKIKIGVR